MRRASPIAVTDADGRSWTRALALSDRETILDGVTRHRDGYLIADARVARVGTQTYKGFEVGLPDRERVTLYRPPEEVFATDSMRSHANKPVTLTHPKRMVDSTTWGKVAKGFSGSDVVRDGDYVRVPLMLTDAAAIDAYETGKARELSVGYTTDIDWTAGATPDGKAYDGVQRDIRVNHHAFVPVARGGENLRFGDAMSTTKFCKDCGGAMAMKDGQYSCKGCGGGQMRDGLNFCSNCGSGLTGDDQMACPTCGFDLKPTPRSNDDDPMEDDDDMMDRFTVDRDGRLIADTSFTAEERRDLAKRGLAKPDGSYPIRNKEDLKHAKEAYARGGATASDKAWINKRAKALGEPLLGETDAADNGISRSSVMPITKTFDGVPIQFVDEISAAAMTREVARLQGVIDAAAKAKKKDDDDDADEEMEREKKERGYQDAIKAKDGEIAVLKKQVADATLTDAQIDARIEERVRVFDAAKPHLAKDFNPAGKSLSDIRRATVAVSLGDAAIKDWDDAQVSGAFAAVTAAGVKKGGATLLADGMSDAMRMNAGRIGGASLADAEADAAKAHAEYVKRLQDGYKTPIGSARN